MLALCVQTLTRSASKMSRLFLVDAHCGDGKRYVVRADEKLTTFLEVESQLAVEGVAFSKRRVSRL